MNQNTASYLVWYYTAFATLDNAPANAKIAFDDINAFSANLFMFHSALSSSGAKSDEEYLLLTEFYNVCDNFYRRGVELKGFLVKYYILKQNVLRDSVKKIEALYEKLMKYMG